MANTDNLLDLEDGYTSESGSDDLGGLSVQLSSVDFNPDSSSHKIADLGRQKRHRAGMSPRQVL